MSPEENMARMIADCLEQHLHEYGWEPYRYPSGEHKGVDFGARATNGNSDIALYSKNGDVFWFEVAKVG